MITLDGSRGEGGGQVLRSSLALSTVTGQPFAMHAVRAGRKRPGLLHQHLASVRAAVQVCGAEVEGAELHSRELTFRPGPVVGGEYEFRVGTAGSATLVLQTVLPALLTAKHPSRVTVEGGTHNSAAPPFDFIARAFLPLVALMGPSVSARLERPGFYPAGGGRFVVEIEPAPLSPISLLDRGAVRNLDATIHTARLPSHVADRERKVLESRLELRSVRVAEVERPLGPGNAVVLSCECEHVTEVFTSFGERGLRAEKVAELAVEECERYLAADVPVGEHLADQLLLLLALARGGSFRTLPLTGHAHTQLGTIAHFLEVPIRVDALADQSARVTVG